MSEQTNTKVLFETNKGNMTIELDEKAAPVSCANFLSYVNDGFYDEVIFHRVIPGFVIQGGGFTEGLKQKKTKAPIKNEAKNGLSNTKGTLSYARTSDPNSATSQFFINVVNNSSKLDPGKYDPHGYAVFGKVIEGMEVAEAIVAVKTQNVGHYGDVPVETVKITKASVIK